jgi:nitrile hydratase accessory protein
MRPPTDDLPALPRDQDGPVFREPWEAHAFALAVRLSEAGRFTWQEWTKFLSEEIRSAQSRGKPDLGDNYYHHWLAALERLCASKGLASPADLARRKEEWRDAYMHTPHGRPVELSHGHLRRHEVENGHAAEGQSGDHHAQSK